MKSVCCTNGFMDFPTLEVPKISIKMEMENICLSLTNKTLDMIIYRQLHKEMGPNY